MGVLRSLASPTVRIGEAALGLVSQPVPVVHSNYRADSEPLVLQLPARAYRAVRRIEDKTRAESDKPERARSGSHFD